MKKSQIILIIAAAVVVSVVIYLTTGKEKEAPLVVEQPQVEFVKKEKPIEKPIVKKTIEINMAELGKVTYFKLPFKPTYMQAATNKDDYKKNSTIIYKGDGYEYTVILPRQYLVWKKNVYDENYTLWLTGWWKEEYKEVVFSDKDNKISPNSFIGENGKIKYRKTKAKVREL